MKTTTLIALTILSFAAAGPAAAQDDRAQVLAVVQRMFDGMRTKDTAMFRSAWVPGGKVYGLRVRQDGTSFIQQTAEQDFAAFIARDTRSFLERTFDHDVRIEREMATVWTPYDFWANGQFSHCGVDAIQLLRTADGWKITSITDTFQREGCPQRPAPND